MPTQPDPAMPSAAPDEFVRRRLELIDGTLSAGFEDDARLQNGVPQRDRASELDFIQMSGLTRGAGAPVRPAGGARPLDADSPLSFFQSGVVDVDVRARAGRGRDVERHQPEPDTALGVPAFSRSADALRALVAELENEGVAQDDTDEVPEPDALDAEDAVAATLTMPAPPDAPEAELDEAALNAAIGAWVVEASPAATPAPEELASLDAAGEDDFDSLLAAFEMPDAQPAALPLESLEDEEPADAYPGAAEALEPFEAPTPEVNLAPEEDDLQWEAEALLAAVSAQPREEEPEVLDTRSIPPQEELASPYTFLTPLPHVAEAKQRHADTPDPESPDDEVPEGEFDYGMVTGRRHYGRHFARRSRRWKRVFALVVVLLIVAVGGGLGYRTYLRPAVLGPERLWSEAQSGVEAGRFDEGSRQFEQYATRFPNDPMRAEALFNAAFYRQLPETAAVVSAKRQEESSTLFEQFLREHPGDGRVDRARVLLGISQFNLKRYDQTIQSLRESAKELNDPTAALPVLRTLASAYRMQNQYRDAESTYLQAATLPKNFAPDADYFALGEMLRAEAALEEDPEARTALLQRAAEYWTRAMDSPAIDPIERDKIQTLMDWLNKEIGAPAGTMETPVIAAPATSPTDLAAPAAAIGQDGSQWDPDPAQEAAYLEKITATP
jgi:TolA-binding protein